MPYGYDIYYVYDFFFQLTIFNGQGERETVFTKNSKFRVLGIDEAGKRAWFQEI